MIIFSLCDRWIADYSLECLITFVCWFDNFFVCGGLNIAEMHDLPSLLKRDLLGINASLTWNMRTISCRASSSIRESSLKIPMSYEPEAILRWFWPAKPAWPMCGARNVADTKGVMLSKLSPPDHVEYPSGSAYCRGILLEFSQSLGHLFFRPPHAFSEGYSVDVFD